MRGGTIFSIKNNILSPDRVYIQREDVVFLSRETNPTGQRESQAPLPELSGTFCLLGVFSMP